jgi:eukaryotic-like serine/threonine-protein kinase
MRAVSNPPTNGVPLTFTDRFERLGLIGEGVASTVHLGHDRKTGEAVAIKDLCPEHRQDPVAFSRFREEADLLSRFHHPYIIDLLAHDLWWEQATLVLELAEQGSLVRRLGEDPVPGPNHLLTWALDVLDALDHIHRSGVVHRDIKPANLLIAADGTVRLCDFGIARRPSSGLTQVGSVLGTPTFMPPEQAHDPHSAGPTADLYALGATLYVSLVRRPAVELVATHLREKALSDLPRPIRPVVERATHPHPDDRYQDALFMHADVERALAELGGACRLELVRG